MTTPQPNTLLAPWNTPFGLPPFSDVRAEDFEPAFAVALRAHRDEIDAIANNTAAPTFENTVVHFDRSGALLKRLDSLFDNLAASESSPALQAAERALAGPIAAHSNQIYLNAALFNRIDAVHGAREGLGLTAEAIRLIERIHLDFVRAGARLVGDARVRYAKVTERLAECMTTFSQNVLADEAEYQLQLEGEADLAGLPAFLRAAAKQAATERGIDGYVITLSRSLIEPFLAFSARADLRATAHAAWIRRGEGCNVPGKYDNRALIKQIMTLRLEQAQLHGYKSYADYALVDTMAGTKEAVAQLLHEVWQPALSRASAEREALQALADAEYAGRGEKTRPVSAADWRYYAEKVRKARYDLDDAEVKPYFSLDRMVDAVFDCAHRLFGLSFTHRADIRAYHADVKTYEVRDGDHKLVGIFLHDNFARATKRGGAWMSSFRWQSRVNGEVIPIIVNNNNFAKAAPGSPTLLSFNDARTLFHEFGHGLHGLLSNVTYERLSGTQVLRDFVELPSQIFEHWLSEREVLKQHARHFETNDAIPDALIDKILAARQFNQGIDTVEYTASTLVDLALHSKTSMEDLDCLQFEADALAKVGMPSDIFMRHRLTHFRHLFASAGYASQYYVYLWAEVLDADGFDAFIEAGDAFDQATAKRLRECIYSAGNTREPKASYRAFRGRDATVTPMLKKRGLVTA